MKISYKCDYSLKTLLELSYHHGEKLLHIKDISEKQDIPVSFLEQILLSLKKGGYVKSKKGPKGGYSLAKPPAQITLGEVIRYVEGSIYPISCIEEGNPTQCDFVPRCGFFGVWKEVGQAISSIVDNLTFEDIKKRTSKLHEHQALHYYI